MATLTSSIGHWGMELERLEIELMKGLKGKGIPMTPEAWKRMRAEAAKLIHSKRYHTTVRCALDN